MGSSCENSFIASEISDTTVKPHIFYSQGLLITKQIMNANYVSQW